MDIDNRKILMGKAKITPTDNGPLYIQGDFVLLDPQGNEFILSGENELWLCRCGHSEEKPFCDGHHKKVGFKSEVKAKA
jgi:CDGSH-type Zn-finger protein